MICTQTTRYNAHSIAEYFATKPGMKLGANVGIRTGLKRVQTDHSHSVVYATVASVLNSILVPMLKA